MPAFALGKFSRGTETRRGGAELKIEREIEREHEAEPEAGAGAKGVQRCKGPWVVGLTVLECGSIALQEVGFRARYAQWTERRIPRKRWLRGGHSGMLA